MFIWVAYQWSQYLITKSSQPNTCQSINFYKPSDSQFCQSNNHQMIPFADSKVDLVKEQKHLFTKIFSKADNVWKIIIFDQANHDVISSLFKLKDFRQNNITLYFNIKQARQQLHGVTAIYLVKPNLENTEQIIKDFEKDLYSSVMIHFSSEPPSTFFSTFAKQLSKRKPSALSRIQKIQYSNVGFQCIDRQMCILPENNELINLLVTLKNQPLFVYTSNEQTQVDLLKQRLSASAFNLGKQDHEQPSLSSKKTKNYTQVLLFNRDIDLLPVIGHGITYASLMEDIWKFNRYGNKLVDKDSKIDLNDQIWLDRKNMLISEMDLEKQCNKIKSKLLSVNNKVEEFSQLTEKNKKMQWHLNIAGQMISQAKQRRLNEFHVIEQDLHVKKMLSGQNKLQFINLLQTAPQSNDKLRLMLAYMLSVQNYDQNQVQELERAFSDIKKNPLYNELKYKMNKDESPQMAGSKYIKKIAKGFWKNLMNQEKKFLLVKYLEKIKDLSEKNLNELGLKMTTLNEMPENTEVQHTVVYCIGGMCFNEYANLTEFHPNVIYCGDKLINYRQFV